MPSLSDEEHRTRAMLLGWEYVDWAHVYISDDDPSKRVWYDANTMEVIPSDRKLEIIQQAANRFEACRMTPKI